MPVTSPVRQKKRGGLPEKNSPAILPEKREKRKAKKENDSPPHSQQVRGTVCL